MKINEMNLEQLHSYIDLHTELISINSNRGGDLFKLHASCGMIEMFINRVLEIDPKWLELKEKESK